MSDRKLVIWSIAGLVALALIGALAMWLIRSKFVSCKTWETSIPNNYERKLCDAERIV